MSTKEETKLVAEDITEVEDGIKELRVSPMKSEFKALGIEHYIRLCTNAENESEVLLVHSIFRHASSSSMSRRFNWCL